MGEEFLEELESLVFEFQFVLVVSVERIYSSGIDYRDGFRLGLLPLAERIVENPSGNHR